MSERGKEEAPSDDPLGDEFVRNEEGGWLRDDIAWVRAQAAELNKLENDLSSARAAAAARGGKSSGRSREAAAARAEALSAELRAARTRAISSRQIRMAEIHAREEGDVRRTQTFAAAIAQEDPQGAALLRTLAAAARLRDPTRPGRRALPLEARAVLEREGVPLPRIAALVADPIAAATTPAGFFVGVMGRYAQATAAQTAGSYKAEQRRRADAAREVEHLAQVAATERPAPLQFDMPAAGQAVLGTSSSLADEHARQFLESVPRNEAGTLPRAQPGLIALDSARKLSAALTELADADDTPGPSRGRAALAAAGLAALASGTVAMTPRAPEALRSFVDSMRATERLVVAEAGPEAPPAGLQRRDDAPPRGGQHAALVRRARELLMLAREQFRRLDDVQTVAEEVPASAAGNETAVASRDTIDQRVLSSGIHGLTPSELATYAARLLARETLGRENIAIACGHGRRYHDTVLGAAAARSRGPYVGPAAPNAARA